MKSLLWISGLFVLLLLSYPSTASADAVAPVPEPISLSMIGLAVASLAGYKIYKKRG